jgi:hypothetical protein
MRTFKTSKEDRDYAKAYYQRNKPRCQAYAKKYNKEHVAYIRVWLHARADKNRKIMRKLKGVPCTDCGNRFHFSAMTFDHLPKYKKRFDISKDMRVATHRMLEEIAKCEVVCANCHAIRTYKRRKRNARKI